MSKLKASIFSLIIIINLAFIFNSIRFTNSALISFIFGVSLIILTKVYFSSNKIPANNFENRDDLKSKLEAKFDNELFNTFRELTKFNKPYFYKQFTPAQKQFSVLENVLREYQSRELSREIDKWWSNYYRISKLENLETILYLVGIAIVILSAIILILQ